MQQKTFNSISCFLMYVFEMSDSIYMYECIYIVHIRTSKKKATKWNTEKIYNNSERNYFLKNLQFILNMGLLFYLIIE